MDKMLEQGFIIGTRIVGSSVMKDFSTVQYLKKNFDIGLKSAICVQLGSNLLTMKAITYEFHHFHPNQTSQ